MDFCLQSFPCQTTASRAIDFYFHLRSYCAQYERIKESLWKNANFAPKNKILKNLNMDSLAPLRIPSLHANTIHLTLTSSYTTYKLLEVDFPETDVIELIGMQARAHQRRIMGSNVPRLQLVFSKRARAYRFGGAPPTEQDFPDVIQRLADAVEFPEATLCVVNFYTDEKSSIAWHTDAEQHLNPARIVSCSFGATRRFLIRAKDTMGAKRRRGDTTLLLSGNRDVIEMLGDFQREFEHSVPKETKPVSNTRVNVTFRWERM
jgi:hypothetical protein